MSEQAKSVLPIYLDYASATPLEPAVRAAMFAYMDGESSFGNPSATSHRYGWLAQEALEAARVSVAEAVDAPALGVYFTSGATESINLALQGTLAAIQAGVLPPRASLGQGAKPHVLTSAAEHKAVLATLEHFSRQGVMDYTAIRPEADGRVTASAVSAAIKPETVLASFMHVNNELGSINPVVDIAAVCQQAGVFLHVDAAQSVGKSVMSVAKWGADLVSFSGHKSYGPKGVGALYVGEALRGQLRPLFFGGTQERRLRPGTVPVQQAVGMAAAYTVAARQLKAELSDYAQLRAQFLLGLKSLPDWVLHADGPECVPNIMSIGIGGVDGEALVLALKDVALSSGSACNSVSLEPSHVLLACGIPRALAASTLRISFGRFSSSEELVRASHHIATVVERLRGASL